MLILFELTYQQTSCPRVQLSQIKSDSTNFIFPTINKMMSDCTVSTSHIGLTKTNTSKKKKRTKKLTMNLIKYNI